MAPRSTATSRGVLALLVALPVLALSLVFLGPLTPSLHAPLCRALGRVQIDALSPGCVTATRARMELQAGHQAMKQKALRQALDHYRAASLAAPDLPEGHLAEGEAAEMLGDYRHAMVAYGRSLDARPTLPAKLRLATAADAVGDTDGALRILKTAYGSWSDHALAGTYGAGLTFGACAPSRTSDPLGLWHVCVNGARAEWRRWYESSQERVPSYVFQILVDTGQREAALALARERGWLRADGDLCSRPPLAIDAATAAMLAVLTQPERADCAVDAALDIADNGGARLGRMLLQDRSANSRDADTRQLARHLLRYRLPDHEVPKLAQALNATGWRLQHIHDNHDEALAVFQRAIEADPRFSWPHHNIGRLYMARRDYEQALVWLGRALEINPDHWRALYNFAIANHHLKRYPEALAAYRKALAISPDDPDLHANVGWVLIRLGEQMEGEHELQAALRLNPELRAARDYLDARYGRDARQGATPFSSQWTELDG